MNEARQILQSESLFTCHTHKEEPIRYIDMLKHRFLCCKCIIYSDPPINSDKLSLYRPNDVKVIASVMRRICREKFESIDESLACLELQNHSNNSSFLQNIKFASGLLPFNQMMQL